MKDIKVLMHAIDYQFKNNALLDLALTHSSYANEANNQNVAYNERLEFLGDSVLGLVISDYLYKTYPEMPEGQLSKIRALVVCEATLCSHANALDIGSFLKLGKGEVHTGGRNRTSILADAFEAIIAAIYLDGGIAAAQKFILKQLLSSVNKAVAGKLFSDYKSALQEAAQAHGNKEVTYQIVSVKGPDHNKEFCAVAVVDGVTYGKGCGRSKKNAEQNAARIALKSKKYSVKE